MTGVSAARKKKIRCLILDWAKWKREMIDSSSKKEIEMIDSSSKKEIEMIDSSSKKAIE